MMAASATLPACTRGNSPNPFDASGLNNGTSANPNRAPDSLHFISRAMLILGLIDEVTVASRFSLDTGQERLFHM